MALSRAEQEVPAVPRPTISTAVALLTTLCSSGVVFAQGTAQAQDFRIASQVFAGNEDVPASTNTTLFHSGIVYDFLDDSPQTTIFDPARKRFILLDASRKWRCEVPTDKVLTFNNQLQANAAERQEPLFRFMAFPQFERTVDEKSGELLLSSAQMNYRLKTLPVKDDGAMRRYVEFSDWYARLNTMLNVGAAPPFPRIAVNRTLRELHEMPTKVRLTIKAPDEKGTERVLALESRHEVQWKLGGDDQRKIAEVKQQLVAFKQVELELFQKNEEQQAARPEAKPNKTR
jgi:hypothetical protein